MEKTPSQVALAEAIAQYKTLTAFAAAVGVRYQVVQQWQTNGVPAEYCPKIERLTDRRVLCEQLNGKVDWAYLRASQASTAA